MVVAKSEKLVQIVNILEVISVSEDKRLISFSTSLFHILFCIHIDILLPLLFFIFWILNLFSSLNNFLFHDLIFFNFFIFKLVFFASIFSIFIIWLLAILNGFL